MSGQYMDPNRWALLVVACTVAGMAVVFGVLAFVSRRGGRR